MRRLAAVSVVSVVSAISFAAFICSSSIALAQTETTKPIGNYTISKGTVTVTHPGQPTAVPVKVRDGVLFRDIIATGSESRTKALFIDDSILTLGENSSVEITEHVFDPNTDTRTAIVNLIKGRLRVLVGKTFLGLGSKFEIHTATASIAARGTYMVIWIEEGAADGTAVPASYMAQAPPTGATGLAVLNGVASLSNALGSVDVFAGSFALVGLNAPPSIPSLFANVPIVMTQIAATAVKSESSPAKTSSTETLASQGQSQTQMAETSTEVAVGVQAPPTQKNLSTNTANIVSGQMDSMMLKEQAAIAGGRGTTLNLQLEFGQ